MGTVSTVRSRECSHSVVAAENPQSLSTIQNALRERERNEAQHGYARLLETARSFYGLDAHHVQQKLGQHGPGTACGGKVLPTAQRFALFTRRQLEELLWSSALSLRSQDPEAQELQAAGRRDDRPDHLHSNADPDPKDTG